MEDIDRWSYRVSDEGKVRKLLQLEPEIQLRSLSGIPDDPGLWQREGLRIRAEFSVPASQRDAFERRMKHDGYWHAPPVKPEIGTLRDPPPNDWLNETVGSYCCALYVYRPNSNQVVKTLSCDNTSARIGSYLFARYDPGTGSLKVWYKNYF